MEQPTEIAVDAVVREAQIKRSGNPASTLNSAPPASRFYATLVPKRYRGKTLENFTGSIGQARDAILADSGVFITGSCGTGKTHLAVGLLFEWLDHKPQEKNNPPIFLPAVEFFAELKSAMDQKIPEVQILDKYSYPPLLVIDDIGAEKISDWSRQIFYTLIDRRYRNMKQTIITSNLDLQKLSELIDDRISSRIVEMGVVVNLTGPDRRVPV